MEFKVHSRLRWTGHQTSRCLSDRKYVEGGNTCPRYSRKHGQLQRLPARHPPDPCASQPQYGLIGPTVALYEHNPRPDSVKTFSRALFRSYQSATVL